MNVMHPLFGRGRIVEASGSGETAKLQVSFEDGRTRNLLARYARLEAI
jgi:hypothetical protein